MKKTMLKKLMCAVLTAVCVATAVVPAMADDVITAEAATKKVTADFDFPQNIRYSSRVFFL